MRWDVLEEGERICGIFDSCKRKEVGAGVVW